MPPHESIPEILERLAALEDAQRVIRAVRVAVEGLRYVAEDARTLDAAKSTAEGAILGVARELGEE
jgi:hypothetical protein